MQKLADKAPLVHRRGVDKRAACGKEGHNVATFTVEEHKVTCPKCLKTMQQFPEKVQAFDELAKKKLEAKESKEKPKAKED